MQVSLATIVLLVLIQFITHFTTEAVTFGNSKIPSEQDDDDNKTSLGLRRPPSAQEIEAALTKAREINELKREVKLLERKYDEANRGLKCPLSLHHGTRHHDNADTGSNANDAFLALRILTKENGYSIADLHSNSLVETFKRVNGFKCDAKKASKCNYKNKYRNIDGSCNNIRNPEWGMAGSVQLRVLPNDYDDETSSPRTKGLNKNQLPNARAVSNIVHRKILKSNKLSKELTLHVMGFGQFLDHDIARTPEQDDVTDCCDNTARKDVDNCFNIIVPSSEKLVGTSDILVPGHCIEVKRSAPLFCPDGSSRGLPIRQQTTSITSFVDASNVYGSSKERLTKLREKGTGYRLATDYFRNKERIMNGPDDTCTLKNSSQSCSLAGDGRVNEVPVLTSYHFLFVKEHNRIADIFKDYYKSNETIFQETRRLVISIMQRIVYDEFLASIFSPSGYRKYQLQRSANYVYEPKTNPTMLNAFGIAYRAGHSWIPKKMRLFNKKFEKLKRGSFNRRTERTFNNPDMTFEPFAFQRLAYYLAGSQSPNTDRFIEEAVRSRLFINRKDNIAFDLAALNIQRGRDHGLPSYNEYRKWCGLSSVRKTWEYLLWDSGLVDHSLIARKKLKLAGYKSPQDIDLFVGGLTETPVSGGQLGPTFECIIGRQFRRLKYGDRIWYQNADARFTKKQISAIEKYSLSRILCNNYKFTKIRVPVFLSKRRLRFCRDIPDLDLSLFKPRYQSKSLQQSVAARQVDETNDSIEDAINDEEAGFGEELRRLLEEAKRK